MSDEEPAGGDRVESEPVVRYETIGPVARVTMNRPRQRNALSRVLLEELDASFARAVADEDVRVVILAGEGDHFSSGHDLGTPDERQDQQRRPIAPGLPGLYERSWRQNVELSLRWRDLPKPTIAQVQGYCIFGGWIIASAMDLVVAADDAQLLPGPVQYVSMPWDLGVRKTKELLWEGRVLSGAEAMELGFVNRVVPRPDLEPATLKLANRIAELDPFMARMIKLSINGMQDTMGFRAAIQAGHSNYMLMQTAGNLGRSDARDRLSLVERALKAKLGEEET